jgi:hypothetical protein
VLVEPESAAALARGIHDVLGHLDRFDSEAIARRALERYGRATVAGMLAEVYAEVTGSSARGTL